MAEDFTGLKPINQPLKPEQETLRDRQDVIDPIDISPMDDAYKALMEKKRKEEEEAAAAAAAAKDDDPPADDQPNDDPPADDQPKDDDPPADDQPKDDDPPADDQPKDDDDPPADDQPKDDDPYEDVQLPANARGKSAEAFATLKQRFATDLKQKETEIAELRSKVEHFESGDPVPEEVKKELEDLRLFRARLDIQADPEFTKKYDGKIETLNDFIYDQLKGTGIISDEHVKRFRELGGFHRTNFEEILEKIDNPQVVRLVQGKLDEIAVTQFERERALNVKKEDVQQYIEERKKAYEQNLTAHHEVTKKELEKIYTEKMPWLKDPAPPKPGDKNAQVIHQDVVKFNEGVRENMAIAARDDTPEMRAILIAGMGQLLYLKRQHGFLTAAYDKLQKEHKAATAELAKIKRASSNRLARSSAPPSGGGPKPKIDYNTSAVESLDALRKEQLNRQ